MHIFLVSESTGKQYGPILWHGTTPEQPGHYAVEVEGHKLEAKKLEDLRDLANQIVKR